MSNPTSNVIRFPASKTKPGESGHGSKDLGYTKISQQLYSSDRSAMGHWCSNCKGIWYSYILENECPVCGNRHG